MPLTEATERLIQGRFRLPEDLFPLTVDSSLPPDVREFLAAMEKASTRGDFTPDMPEPEPECESDGDCDCEFSEVDWDDSITPQEAIGRINTEFEDITDATTIRRILESIVHP